MRIELNLSASDVAWIIDRLDPFDPNEPSDWAYRRRDRQVKFAESIVEYLDTLYQPDLDEVLQVILAAVAVVAGRLKVIDEAVSGPTFAQDARAFLEWYHKGQDARRDPGPSHDPTRPK